MVRRQKDNEVPVSKIKTPHTPAAYEQNVITRKLEKTKKGNVCKRRPLGFGSTPNCRCFNDPPYLETLITFSPTCEKCPYKDFKMLKVNVDGNSFECILDC